MKTRSRKGCLTCRERKIKCDEQTPTCGQCTKANRDCQPSPAVVFRHQQNASLNSDQDGLEHFYGYKKTFDTNSVWVNVPKRLSFVHVTDPYDEPVDDSGVANPPDIADPWADTVTPSSDHAYLSTVTTNESYQFSPPEDRTHDSFHNPRHERRPSAPVHTGSVQDLSFILNQPNVSFSPTLSNAHRSSYQISQKQPQPSQYQPDPYSAGSLYRDDAEVAYLLRFFSTGCGHWMDLFDLGRFFEMEVIIKAARCPLLLYSAIALSAKSLGRMHSSSRKFQEAPIIKTNEEWLHTARTYYHMAINHLRQALAAEAQSPDEPHPGTDPMHLISTDLIANNLHWSHSLPGPNDDELVGTTAILCVYEFLDASSEEWSRHLDGAKTLFDITKDGVLAVPDPTERRFSNSRRHSANSRTAIFWNMARQDMLDAFITDSATRLDTEDIAMWRRVALHISDEGLILPSNNNTMREPMQDDMICNALVWLAMQVVNFIATIKSGIRSHTSPAPRLHLRLQHIATGLDAWQAGLPDSFRAICASHSGRRAGPSNYPEKWFTRPMCAATMQWHHFLRVMILHARQYLTTGGCIWSPPGLQRRLHPRLLAEAQAHAREMVGINLAQTDEGMLVHSVQPLFAAGQIMRLAGEHEAVDALIGHMRWIERETGCAMEYRVKDLLQI